MLRTRVSANASHASEVILPPAEAMGNQRRRSGVRDDLTTRTLMASFRNIGWTPDVTKKTNCPREWTVGFRGVASAWKKAA